jgi:hypothetical protein
MVNWRWRWSLVEVALQARTRGQEGGSGWGGVRQLGRAGGNGNWHLQWSHYRSEGGGRKCGRVNGGGGGNEGPDRLG